MLARGQIPTTTARMMPAETSRTPKSLRRLTNGPAPLDGDCAAAGVVTVSR